MLEILVTHEDEARDQVTFVAADHGEHRFSVNGGVGVVVTSVEAQKFARSIFEAVGMVDGNGGRGLGY